MAQSRPPPVRVHSTTTSPPPLSPRVHSEKKHHSRRKSGKSEQVTSEKKSSRAPALTRKTTPQHTSKSSTSRSHREKEEEERGRDSGESFPQFCMSCEKQFLSASSVFLYCSETCRIHDLNPSQPRSDSYTTNFSTQSNSPPLTPYARTTFPSHEDGPDIIPPFSPTQSRPRSYFASEPYPPPSSSYNQYNYSEEETQQPQTLSSSTPHTSKHSHSHSHSHSHRNPSRTTNSTALESLRELAIALPKTSSSSSSSRRKHSSRTHHDTHSPPKSTASSMSKNGSAVWGYMPFTKTSTPAATPSSSYTGVAMASPYVLANGYPSYGATGEDSYGYGNTGGMGMDRPLPPRGGPGGYGHRPKSIDLVTPFGGH